MKKLSNRCVLAMLSALSLGTAPLWAQTAPKESPVPVENEKTDEDTITLSPFVVSAEEDDGYLATSTLAGSRVRTDLKDIASSITVVTKQFMNDIGAVNNTSLLTYTTNTEVGGLYGNFAGIGNPYINGAAEGVTNLLRPQTNTRVRGLDSADNTRDYFQTDIPWDGFNIGRVDMQRGPNSILFGIGSPAGIINTSVNTAGYKTEGYVQNRIDQFGSMRNSVDYNQVLISKELAVRVAAVDDYSKYRQKPAFNRAQRLFGAVRWDPQLFGKDSSARTSIRANSEHGNIKANRPRSLPPKDRLTPFFDADKINKQFIDGQDADAAGILSYRTRPGAATNYWLGGGRGVGEWDAPVLFFNNTATPISAQQGRPRGGQYADTGLSTGNFFPVGIASYGSWASELDRWGPANGLPASVLDPVAGASKGFYKDKQITDPNIFDFYNILIDGPNKKEWQGWKSYDVSFEQTFFQDRLGFQAVYDRQYYHDGSEGLLGWSPYLSIDIMKNTMQYPGVYTDLAVANPNAGRVYTSGTGSGGSRETDRENIRFTAYGELRAKDYLGDGLLSRILGHHTITALVSQEKYDVEDRSWNRYAASNTWTDLIMNPAKRSASQQKPAPMAIEQITYLTGNVTGFASASQLHIPGIAVLQAPPTTLAAKYYDSHWKWPTNPSHPDYVDPNALWSNPTGTDPTPDNSTQASNPANYVGWVDTTVSVLNADKGDINDLYTSGSKNRSKTYSRGVTWQAYLFEDLLVGTGGWRKDTIKIRSGYPDADIITQTGIPSMDYDLQPQDERGIKSGENVSWGVVAHLPRRFREKLPWNSNISLGFNNSNNNRVENRYGFHGDILPNAKGHSRDYSIVLSTLDDRLTFKVAYYKTTVKDANISSVSSETSTLGSATGTLRSLETLGTASALMMLAGYSQTPGNAYYNDSGKDFGWYWNWAMIAGIPGATTDNHAWDGDYWNPAGTAESKARFEAHPETIKARAAVQAWFDNMLPQSWFDAFGYDFDVAKVKAGDYRNAIRKGGWQPNNYLGGQDATPGAGRISGVYPTGTVDNESKGWEFELTGRPLKNWDISLNASKQFASQTALGADLVEFIELQYAKFQGPAGDLRQWWGGDRNFRTLYNESVWAAYQFQKETNGKLVGEMAPWRFNMVNNYRFDKGLLKGSNVGFAYRWQDGTIQGYALNETRDNLDINKPYWSQSEDYIDLWAGYERKLSDKIKWRVQVNVGNVGDKPRLIPYNVQPDGTPGGYRIQEGMTWSLTNTLSF